MEIQEPIFYLAVFFSGHVQGVGFRYTTAQVAKGYDVTGFVRNLSDGRVQMEVEGEEKECRQFLAAVEDELDAFIRNSDTSEGSRQRSFHRFQIA